MDQQESDRPQDKEVLDILLESDLYLELPLKERQQLFKHIIKEYLCPVTAKRGIC